MQAGSTPGNGSKGTGKSGWGGKKSCKACSKLSKDVGLKVSHECYCFLYSNELRHKISDAMEAAFLLKTCVCIYCNPKAAAQKAKNNAGKKLRSDVHKLCKGP